MAATAINSQVFESWGVCGPVVVVVEVAVWEECSTTPPPLVEVLGLVAPVDELPASV
jgi:hypothetical protein